MKVTIKLISPISLLSPSYLVALCEQVIGYMYKRCATVPILQHIRELCDANMYYAYDSRCREEYFIRLRQSPMCTCLNTLAYCEKTLMQYKSVVFQGEDSPSFVSRGKYRNEFLSGV